MSSSSPRRRARELVLQGLYERQLAGSPSDRIAADLAESHGYQRADQTYFAELWRGAAGDYDALLVRSQVQVDAGLIAAGPRLVVIGRAGVGVDNVDLDAATRAGIVVVNAPTGNTIAAAEHTLDPR